MVDFVRYHNFLNSFIKLTAYTISQSIGGTCASPVQAQAKACGYHKLLFDCNSVLQVTFRL
jgi:hypothetical protein